LSSLKAGEEVYCLFPGLDSILIKAVVVDPNQYNLVELKSAEPGTGLRQLGWYPPDLKWKPGTPEYEYIVKAYYLVIKKCPASDLLADYKRNRRDNDYESARRVREACKAVMELPHINSCAELTANRDVIVAGLYALVASVKSCMARDEVAKSRSARGVKEV